MKALGKPLSLELRRGLEQTLSEKIESDDVRDQYFRRHYALQNALDEEVRRIMGMPAQARTQSLEDLFAEYSDLSVKEILDHPEMYEPEEGEAPSGGVYLAKSMTSERVALRQLEAGLRILVSVKKSQNQGETYGK